MDKRTFLKTSSVLGLGSLVNFSALGKLVDSVSHLPASEVAKAQAQAAADAEAKAREEFAREQDVIPWLRELKFSLADARKGAAACAHIPDAPIEQRMKVALRALAPHCVRIPAPSASAPA